MRQQEKFSLPLISPKPGSSATSMGRTKTLFAFALIKTRKRDL